MSIEDNAKKSYPYNGSSLTSGMDAAEKIKEETTMRINTNLTAMNTFNQVTKNQNKISSAVGQLSSGSAITSAADNAAGLAISEKMRAQIRGLDKASSNAQDAISLVQTAESALSSATSLLQRMRELAVQSSSDTNNNDIDRTALQDEFNQLNKELNDIASNTTFNKKTLLDGSLSSTKNSITNLSLANNSLGVTLGKSQSGAYSFAVKVKEETPAVGGSVAAAKSSQTAASYNFIASNGTSTALQSTSAATKTSQYNGNYALSTKINDDKSITVTANGDNGQSFTASIDAATLSAGFAKGGSVEMKFGDGKTAFTTSLTMGAAYADSDNARQALADDIKNVAVSVTGGVDKKDATYANYATMTGADDVKLAVGDTSATFSNGVTVSFDKLTTTDLTVGYTNDNITYDYAGVNVQTGLANGTASAGAGTLSASISGAKTSLDGKDIVINASGQVTIGDYTSTTTLPASITTDTDAGTGAVGAATYQATGTKSITMQNAAGDTFNVDFTVTTAADADNTKTDVITLSGAASVTTLGTETTNANYTYAVTDSNPAAASGTVYAGSGATTATTTMSNLQITSSTDKNTVDIGRFEVDSYASDASGNLTVNVIDDKGNAYTAQLAATEIAAGQSEINKTLSFSSTTSTVKFTMDMNVKADTAAATIATTANITDGANDIAATVNSTFANQTGVLSDALAKKAGVASDAGNKATTASTFNVNTSANAGLTFQVGANSGDTMTINIEKMDSKTWASALRRSTHR